jgi:hypothetical protein
MDGGEEVIEYIVGPRGKVEVGSGSVAGLVRAVYGKDGDANGDEGEIEGMEREDFEGRLGRTLGAHVVRKENGNGNGNGDGEEGESPVRENGHVGERVERRSTRQAEQEDDDGEEDSSE